MDDRSMGLKLAASLKPMRPRHRLDWLAWSEENLRPPVYLECGVQFAGARTGLLNV